MLFVHQRDLLFRHWHALPVPKTFSNYWPVLQLMGHHCKRQRLPAIWRHQHDRRELQSSLANRGGLKGVEVDCPVGPSRTKVGSESNKSQTLPSPTVFISTPPHWIEPPPLYMWQGAMLGNEGSSPVLENQDLENPQKQKVP